MKAYLIDPSTQTVTEVKYDGNFKSIYQYIGASTFDCARFNKHGDAVFVDDEGLINGQEQAFFLINGYPTPLAGKGLVLGCDMNTGESQDPEVDMAWLRKNVRFGMAVIINDQLCWVPTGVPQ